MGYEYMLDFKVAKPEEADRVLRSVAGFEAFDPRFDLYYFRRASTGPMPDAQAAIEDAGIYVCDNGGSYQVVKDIPAATAATGPSAEPRPLPRRPTGRSSGGASPRRCNGYIVGRHLAPAMDKLLGVLISAWCWLRVAASPTLIGAALGVGAYYLIGGTRGLVAGGCLALLGLFLGLRLANYARRKDHLVEFAHGLPTSKSE